MRIKFYFILLLLLLLVIGGALFLYQMQRTYTYIYIAMGMVVVALFYLSIFYQKLVKPLRTIANGMDLLREQDFSSRLSNVGQAEADRLVNLFNRMMDQLKNERLRLREQNQFLDLLIAASPMGVVITTFDYQFSILNRAAERILGQSGDALAGKNLSDLKEYPLFAELNTLPMNGTRVVRLNDASVYKCTHSSFIDCGFKHPFFLIEPMTDEVMRAERRAYEKVIRMIAHEVNNSTAGITSTLDTVQQVLADDSAQEDLRQVLQVCMERCYSMSRFITRFADVVKIPEPVLLSASLNDLAESCTHFMQGMCSDRDIQLLLDTDDGMLTVKMDAALIEQVLLNIIKNSVESIETASVKGKIIVRTHAPATIEIIDNGQGIAPEVADKLFTPFFSTKPTGQGIGLVFIREVLSRHGCTFFLRTMPDGLTYFNITFPI